MTLISAALQITTIPLTLSFDSVRSLPPLYSATLAGLLLTSILVVSVSYLTGQAKIDIEASIGKKDV